MKDWNYKHSTTLLLHQITRFRLNIYLWQIPKDPVCKTDQHIQICLFLDKSELKYVLYDRQVFCWNLQSHLEAYILELNLLLILIVLDICDNVAV